LPASRHVVPVLKSAIGQGQPWIYTPDGYRCVFPFAVSALWGSAVLVRFLPDPRMRSTLANADIALVDTSISARSADCPSCLYVVSPGQDTLIRWIRGGAKKLYLVDEHTWNRPAEWEMLPVSEDQRLTTIKGSIVWLGMEAVLRWV